MFRHELNCTTGESTEIAQAAYTNGNQVIVLDVGQPPPTGYVAISSEAAQAANAADLQASVLAQIDTMERASLMNRGVRELSLRIMEDRAATDGTDLSTVPAYVKIKALDDEIAALRAQL